MTHPDSHSGMAQPRSKNKWVTTNEPPSFTSTKNPKNRFRVPASGGHPAHRKNSRASSAPIAAPKASDKNSGCRESRKKERRRRAKNEKEREEHYAFTVTILGK